MISRESRRDKISPRQGYGYLKLAHPAHSKRCQEFSGPGRLLQTFCQEFRGYCRSSDLLAQKDPTWSWQELHAFSIAKLKQVLADSTILAHPNMSQHFTLHLDSSADALGATLSQPDRRGHLRLLTCTSRKLNPAERNYHTHGREMLALVHALKNVEVLPHGQQGARVH